MKRLSGIASAGLLALYFISACQAQSYPLKPVRLVVPYPPGGVDITARQLQPAMQADLGQPIVIENRPGAGSVTGSDFVARSVPDGYTMMMTSSNHLITAATQKNIPYDVINDFSPITLIFDAVSAFGVPVSVPANTLSEFIEYARRIPGKLSYASTAIGGLQHIETEHLKQVAGIDMVHVPYNGFGPIAPALMAAQVQFAYASVQFLKPMADAGKVRLLAVAAPRRLEMLPAVPTIVETIPGWQTGPGWVGFMGPARLSSAVVKRFHDSALKAILAPDVQQRFRENAAITVANSPEEFTTRLRQEFESVQRLVKALNINVQE